MSQEKKDAIYIVDDIIKFSAQKCAFLPLDFYSHQGKDTEFKARCLSHLFDAFPEKRKRADQFYEWSLEKVLWHEMGHINAEKGHFSRYGTYHFANDQTLHRFMGEVRAEAHFLKMMQLEKDIDLRRFFICEALERDAIPSSSQSDLSEVNLNESTFVLSALTEKYPGEHIESLLEKISKKRLSLDEDSMILWLKEFQLELGKKSANYLENAL